MSTVVTFGEPVMARINVTDDHFSPVNVGVIVNGIEITELNLGGMRRPSASWRMKTRDGWYDLKTLDLEDAKRRTVSVFTVQESEL